MNERDKLMRKLHACSFSQWELHIFLDTHPENREAAAQLKKMQEEYAVLRKQYEDTFGPIDETSAETSRFAWITDPWPWEIGGSEA